MAEEDIFRAYNFKLDIKGVTAGHFTKVSNMGVDIEVIEYREGTQGSTVRKLPGWVKYSDITLSYGLTNSFELWQWLSSAVQGNVERKNVSIILVGTDGITEVTRWNLTHAWPSSWRGALLDAMSQEAAIEELTLSHEGLDRA